MRPIAEGGQPVNAPSRKVDLTRVHRYFPHAMINQILTAILVFTFAIPSIQGQSQWQERNQQRMRDVHREMDASARDIEAQRRHYETQEAIRQQREDLERQHREQLAEMRRMREQQQREIEREREAGSSQQTVAGRREEQSRPPPVESKTELRQKCFEWVGIITMHKNAILKRIDELEGKDLTPEELDQARVDLRVTDALPSLINRLLQPGETSEEISDTLFVVIVEFDGLMKWRELPRSERQKWERIAEDRRKQQADDPFAPPSQN